MRITLKCEEKLCLFYDFLDSIIGQSVGAFYEIHANVGCKWKRKLWEKKWVKQHSSDSA